MKFLPLIWAALTRKPLRTTLTTLALVVAFVLFGLLEGINAGFNTLVDAARDNGLYVNARYGVPMPMSYKAQLARLPGVQSVTAMSFLGGMVNGDPKRQIGMGFVDDARFFDFYRWIVITPAQIEELRATRDGIVVGKSTADRLGLKAGDRITVKSQLPRKSGGNDWPLTVLRVVDRSDIPGSPNLVVGNFEYVNEERAAGKDLANLFMLLMTDANLSVPTARTIDAMFLNSSAPTHTNVDKLDQAQQFDNDTTPTMVNSIVLAALFALLLMTSSAMMQSFRERIPELGTLKAIGFSDAQVLALVVAEAVAQSLLGAAIGLGFARGLLPLVRGQLTGPQAFLTVSWPVVGAGLAIACAVALVSAALPAWRAGRMQIVEALARR